MLHLYTHIHHHLHTHNLPLSSLCPNQSQNLFHLHLITQPSLRILLTQSLSMPLILNLCLYHSLIILIHLSQSLIPSLFTQLTLRILSLTRSLTTHSHKLILNPITHSPSHTTQLLSHTTQLLTHTTHSPTLSHIPILSHNMPPTHIPILSHNM